MKFRVLVLILGMPRESEVGGGVLRYCICQRLLFLRNVAAARCTHVIAVAACDIRRAPLSFVYFFFAAPNLFTACERREGA